MDRLTSAERLAVAVTVPAFLVGLAWTTALAIAGVTGQHPVWGRTPLSLAEAAAFGDRAAVVRRLGLGEDPTVAGQVRLDIDAPRTAVLTPMEAAATSGDIAMMQFLFEVGVQLDPAAWQRARCITDDSDVRALLDARRPAGAPTDCATLR